MNKKMIRKIANAPGYYIFRIITPLVLPFYKRLIMPRKVRVIRKRDIVRVLFVLNELGSWKTENLYTYMLQHPRFSPYLLLVPESSAPYAYDILKNYVQDKGYEFNEINPNESIKRKFRPDIIFYQKPYGNLPRQYYYCYNLSSLFCMVPYCFRNRNIPNRKIDYFNYVWQNYVENETILKEKDYPNNMIATGLPIMDNLLKDRTFFPNPWNECFGKKKIIYAPHHTISTESFKSLSPIDYATFLEYAYFMLDMAKKYKEKVQWTFKPHPLLKYKLYKIWGEEATNHYYKQWEEMDNCQIAEGEYMGLFKHSDAMIHDCGSFKIEYLYTGNPVMYLDKEDQNFDYPNWQTQEALKLHYHGRSKQEIELFVQDVIAGVDPLKDQRDNFVHSYLTPPHGKSACENIVNAILGRAEFEGK